MNRSYRLRRVLSVLAMSWLLLPTEAQTQANLDPALTHMVARVNAGLDPLAPVPISDTGSVSAYGEMAQIDPQGRVAGGGVSDVAG